ncbi:MAG TPA: DUF4349 domain-containing protein, partial [Solirubrobacteraceae bacterium]|nr:DUF4349 domain-containing protein [Solirubrobacteraceae bacterium]
AAAALGLGVVVLAGGGGGGEPAGLQGAGSARTGGSAGAGARQRAGGTAGLEGPGSAGTSSSAGAGARQRAGATAGSGDLGGGGGGAVGVAPDAATAAPGRRVERGVRLDLRAGLGRFDAVTDGLVRVTQRAGGFVAASEIARTRNAGTATFVLRIPAVRLDAAVAQLSRLAHVRALEQSSQDVTGEWDGVARRLADARTQRRALVAALATATGAQAVRLRARLDRVTARVRGLEEQRRALRGRTRYGTVDATVIARRSGAAAAPPGGSWTPADAWRDARRVLEVAAGVAIVAVAALLPLALLGLAVGAGAQALRRRRREAALG